MFEVRGNRSKPAKGQIGGTFGTMYEVILLPKARKVYATAEKGLAKKLSRCFQSLEESPKGHSNIKRLKVFSPVLSGIG